MVNRQILDIGLTFGRQIAILGIGLASLPLLAWVLGPEGLGAFTLLAATLAIASTLACGGIGSAYLFFAGKSRLRKDSVSPVVWKQIFVGFFVGGACVAAATPFLLASSIVKEIGALAFLYLGFSLAIVLFQAPAIALARCGKQFGLISIFEISTRVANVIVLAAFALCDVHSLGYLLVFTVAVNATTMCGWWLYTVRREQFDEKPGDEVGFWEMAGYSWKSASANVVAQLNYKTDIFLLAAWSTPFQLGIYGVAVMIAEKAWMLSRSIGEVSLSYLTQTESSEEQMINEAIVTAKWTGVTTLAICLCIALVCPFLPIVLGERFAGTALPILFLLPGILFLGISRILSNALAAIGKPGLNVAFGLVGCAFNIVVNFLLIPTYGAIGAAIATSISYFVLLSLRVIFLKRNGYAVSSLFSLSCREISQVKSIIKNRFGDSVTLRQQG